MGENVRVFWPPGYRERLQNPFLVALSVASRDPDARPPWTPSDREAVRAEGFEWVVLHRELIDSELNRPGAGLSRQDKEEAMFRVLGRLVEILGTPAAAEGPLVSWCLAGTTVAPIEIAATEDRLWTRSWERPEPLPYEARLYELGRIK
jgi:hypothetical protein